MAEPITYGPPIGDVLIDSLVEPPPQPGPFARGVKSGVAGVKSSLYGMGALAARGAANVLPAAAVPVATGLEQAALENVAAQNEVASQGAMSFEDVVADPLRAGEYFKFLLGSAVPSLAMMAAGGGVGAGLGAVATRGSAAALTARALGTVAPAVRTGALAGAVAPDFALEAGSIYPEALKTGVENPALRSVAGGGVAAALDFIPLLAAEKYLKPIGKGGIGALAKGALKGAPVGAALEGTQEMGQAVVERGAAGHSLTDQAAVSDYINSFLGGAAPGTVFGAGIGARRQSAAPVVEPAPIVPDLGTNVPDLGTPPPADITPPAPEVPSTPEAIYADLKAQYDSATAQEDELTPLMGALQQAQQEGEAKIAALAAEAKLPPGERRVKSEILAEKKDWAAQVKEVKAKIEETGGQLNAARTTRGDLIPRVTAAWQAIPPAPLPEGTLPALATPEIPPRPAPLGSDLLADPNLPLPTPAEHIDRAVKGVHALFREQGMPLTTTEESLATPPQTTREVALAKVEQRAPREVVPQANPAQMAAIEENAMSVIEPLAKTLAETKTKTPEGQAKVAAKMVKAMRAVVQEAAKQPSIEAAQQYVTDNLPNALKGHGVTADAADMAKAVNAGVGLAKTQFSKGATSNAKVGAAFSSLVQTLGRDDVSELLSNWNDSDLSTDGTKIINYPGRDGRQSYGELGGKVRLSKGEFLSWLHSNTPLDPAVFDVTEEWKSKIEAARAATGLAQESNAALTQDEFDRLPEPAQFAAVDAYNRVMRERGTALRQQLAGIIGDRPELKIMTFSAEPGGPIGSYTRTGPLKAAISMALNAKEGLGVADHEGYHFAEDWLLTAAERQVVANALKEGKPLYTQLVARLQQYDRENQTNLTDEVTGTPAEARAYGFEFWRRGELKADGPLARAWQKLQQFFERVANAVKGLGFTSIEDVFAALDRGQMAEREMVAGEGGAFNSMGADYLQSPAFKKWFGDSKVVDADGKPLVVYHGTTVWDNGTKQLGDITVFDREASTKIVGRGPSMDLIGTWVTPDSAHAANYSGSQGAIYPLYVSITNPFKLNGADAFDQFLRLGQKADPNWKPKYKGTKSGEMYNTPAGRFDASFLRAKLMEKGYDGIEFAPGVDASTSPTYVAFRPEQIKSAIGNTGTFDPNNPDIRFSTSGAQEWYRSALTDAVVAVNTKAAPAQGWKDQIKGLVAKGAVKQVEIDAVGLNEWLDLQQGKVTKEQVVSFVKEHGVQVREVVLGDTNVEGWTAQEIPMTQEELDDTEADGQNAYQIFDATGALRFRTVWADTPEMAVRKVSPAGEQTKFSGYQLPGGENYRELLLTLPTPDAKDVSAKVAALDARIAGYEAKGAELRAQYPIISERPPEVQNLIQTARDLAQELMDQRKEALVSKDSTFRSSHFDQPNILAHIRFNERTDANGKRVLFIEEIQSDWAQKGRKEGFGAIQGWLIRDTRNNMIVADYTDKARAEKSVEGKPHLVLEPAPDARVGIPAAPFVTKTEAWTALALKRMIRYAAENGFDSVAWTTGEQQAARYDLSAQVDHIAHYKDGNGKLRVAVQGTNGEEVWNAYDPSAKELEDTLGKEITEKILNDEGTDSGAGVKILRGLDLKVGGEGMKGYYDKIVPLVANDILKKLGGGKVGEVTISTEGKSAKVHPDDQLLDYLRSSPENKQPGFTLTPELAERAAFGLPLFSKAAIEKSNRMANGELEAMQLGEQYAHLIQNANPSADLMSRAFGVVKEDIVGGLGRWWTNQMSTPNYIAAASAGFKNVYQAFNTYSRYRKILSEQLVRERLPGWYKASDADRQAAFDVMLKRTVGKYATNSQELADLLRTLTPEQRKLYDQATGMIAGVLQRQFESQKETRKRQLTSPGAYEKWLANRQEQMNALLDTGYVPLRRYGDYSVSVFMEAPDGSRVQAGLEFFSSPSAAKAASIAYAREIERSGVALKVEMGRRSKNERDTGVSLEQFLGTLRRQGIDISQAERERLVVAMTNADSIVRTQMMRREGLAGYSTDGMRVLHEFGVNTTSEIAYARFAPVLDAALDGAEVTADVNSVTSEPIIEIGEAFGRREDGVENNLWKRDGPMSGFYKDRANAMADTTLAPDRHSEWATKLRTAGVMYFIGGSLSGAAVNTLSIPMVLVPRLSLHTDYLNASMTSLKAWKDAWQHYTVLRDMDKMKNPDAETAAKLDAAGITKEMRASIVAAADHIFDTEIHMMLGISQGSLYSKSRNIQRAAEAWMAPFRVAEQTNRLASFIAAYKVATTGEGVKQADGTFKRLSGQELFRFASEVVDATQNNYNVNNRPGIMNNPVGALMFQFKSFPLFIIEAAALMYKVSPKSAVYMLLGLVAMSGVQGLPFAEEILNLVDVISQRLFNSPFNSRRAMRNVIKSASDAIGAVDLSDAVMRGVVNEITGVNIATRVSGGLLPGTRIGAADATEGRVLSELAGAPYSMVKDALSNAGGLVSGVAGGDWKKAADALRAGGPIAVRNAIKGAEQLSQGYATDSKGRKLADVTTLDGLLQLTGLSSAAVAKMNDLDSIIIQTKAFHSQVSQDLQNQLVKAYRDDDQERIQQILDLRAKWNEQNPEMPVMANPSAIRRAIALAGMPLNRRERILLGRRLGGAFADVTDQMAE